MALYSLMKPLPSAGPKVRYGITFQPITIANGQVVETPDWMIEKQILQNYEKLTEFPGHQLKAWCEHFCRLVEHIFGDPNGTFYFEWNPNARRILYNTRKHNILSVAGHASSSKSETLGLLAVMMYFLDPENTKVLVTSTTVSSAQEKIWGKVKAVWNHLSAFLQRWLQPVPGKLLDSKNKIRYQGKDNVGDELKGITLVVGEKSQAKESAEKIQGTKQGKVFLVGDEFATLEPSLLNTALMNLRSNPEFHLWGAFNPDTHFDPGGMISRPVGGWHTVTEEDDEWPTLIEPYGISGYCIRFDGLKSPNVVARKTIWKGLLTHTYLEEFTSIGTKTKEYYKMFRGFWSLTGVLDAIYNMADIIHWRADAKVTTWASTPTIIAGFDPAFAHGGDKAVLVIGKVGDAYMDGTDRKTQKVFEMTHMYIIDDDITNTTVSKSEWAVKILKKRLQEHHVTPQNLAVDATGGGDPFGALLAREIGLGFLNVNFAGSASDKPVSRNDKRKGKERFKNMVSELWYVGKELIRTSQIKGIFPDVMSEMVVRTYKESGKVVQVESKDDMKVRCRKSPDRADAFFLCCHVARMKHGLSSNEQAARQPVKPNAAQNSLFPPFNPNQRPTQQAWPSRFLVQNGGWASKKA